MKENNYNNIIIYVRFYNKDFFIIVSCDRAMHINGRVRI